MGHTSRNTSNGTLALAAALAVLLALPAPVLACDVDADCGPGGTCIKREKRARGVCYGRAPADAPTEPPAATRLPDHVQNREALESRLEGTGIACQVTQQCPAGLECVIAGYTGQCMRVE